MTSVASAPMRIIEKIKRRSSAFLFGTDLPPSITSKQEPKYNDNAEILPFFVGHLTDEMVEEAKNVLNETEETRINGLLEIRKLIESEEKLYCRTDDLFLLQFLRARKFNVKKAFKLLQNYFEFRKEYSYIYDNSHDVSKIKKVFLRNFIGYLTKRDRAGNVVLLAKIGKWKPEIDTFEDLFVAVTGMLVLAVEDPATQVTGFRVIIDFRGLGWKQMKICTPQNLLLLVRSTQFCFPARYKGIHLFSENKLFNIVMSMVHPFLTTKLKNRIIHHGKNVNALYEYINPLVLPEEYGGEAGPYDNSSWDKYIEEMKGTALDMLNYGYK